MGRKFGRDSRVLADSLGPLRNHRNFFIEDGDDSLRPKRFLWIESTANFL